MSKKLFGAKTSESISPLIDVVMNGFAAMFIILIIYMAAFNSRKPIAPLMFIETQPPPVIRGQNYVFTFPVIGGVGNRHFKLISGDLSSLNLKFDSDTGTVFGSANANLKTSLIYPVKVACVVEVNDSARQITRHETTFIMSSTAIPYPETPFTITYKDDLLPEGRVGRNYEVMLGASGGIEPYQWHLSTGKMPKGLSIDCNNGRVYGKPAEAGKFTFEVMAEYLPGEYSVNGMRYTWVTGSSTKHFEMVVHDPLIHSLYLPTGRVGENYFATVNLNGKLPKEHVTWTSQVPGLTFFDANGIVTGIPQQAGKFKVGYQIANGTEKLGVGESELQILPAVPKAEVGGAVFNLWAGEPVECLIPYCGVCEPVTIINLTPLPAGLRIERNVLKGQPKVATLETVELRIQDALGAVKDGRIALRISPRRKPLKITSPEEILVVVGKNTYWHPLVQGAEGIIEWHFADDLPPGLEFADNQLKGKPTTPGTWKNQLIVKDIITESSIAQPATIRAVYADETVPKILTASAPSATMLIPYELTLSAIGGIGLIRFDITGALPAGIKFNNGNLTGTPTEAGIWPVKFTATDEVGQSSNAVDLKIAVIENYPKLLAKTIPPALVDTPFEFNFPTNGGIPPLKYLIAGSLPSGLSLTDYGLNGVPITPGSYTLDVSVTDSVGQKAGPVRYNFVVARTDQSKPEIISSLNLPKAIVDQYYELMLAASGGIGKGQIAFDGNAPPGLSFNEQGLSGIPTVAGTFEFDAVANDQAGQKSPIRHFQLSIVRLDNSRPVIITQELSAAIPGHKYIQVFAAEGGIGKYKWNFDGKLPQGLMFTANGIEGTLSSEEDPGKWPITFFVQDDAGQMSPTSTSEIVVLYWLSVNWPSAFNCLHLILSDLLLANHKD